MKDAEEIFVLDKKVRLLQPEKGFRTSLDSVMLAAACPAKNGARVLDLGCGAGGASFCVLARLPDCCVTGIDIQDDYIALARNNIALNKAQGKAQFHTADSAAYDSPEKADYVICNPPYLESGTYTPSPDESRAVALGHDGGDLTLKDWVDAGFRNLKSGGTLTMIHRADMTDKIIQALGRRFGAVEIIPLWPRAGEPAKRVIVRAIKDRQTPCILHAGLVLHEADGRYTPQAEAVLREGQAIV